MPTPTVSLSTVTLARQIGPGDSLVQFSSATGLLPNLFVFLDGELIRIVSNTGITDGLGTWFKVLRGCQATRASRHSGNATGYIGRGDQFYNYDPEGAPSETPPVSPHINLNTGVLWVPQGDDTDVGQRWWAKYSNTHDVGPLGVRTNTLAVDPVTRS